MTPEYLISILLRVGRKKDIEKIERLLEQTEIEMEKLKYILQKYGLSEKFKNLCRENDYGNRRDGDIKISMKGRIITRRDLFKKKEEFHREQAKLPFEEKIKIFVQLQKIAKNVSKLKKMTLKKV